jgi:WD40 repeat protein/transcriptional regulator with XRE-family HTH domain
MLRSRDFRSIFNLARLHGVSPARLALSTGLADELVRKIMSGDATVAAPADVERIADALNIPLPARVALGLPPRARDPLHMPLEFWERAEIAQALIDWDIPAVLAAIMNRRRWSQHQLADILGYSQSWVSNVMRRTQSLTLDQARTIVLHFGAPLHKLTFVSSDRNTEFDPSAMRTHALREERLENHTNAISSGAELSRLPGLRRVAPGHLTSWSVFAPGLEPGMVDRTPDLETLISLLTDAAQAPAAASVVAVVGPGGFGKTTLTTQACHDARITGSFSEIMWVETGEHCTPARVVQLVSDLSVHLGGERPTFSDAEQAGFHLARVLGDRPVLIAIDNVWSAADLAPFLLGGPNTVRLVTTRNARVCPAHTLQLRLGPMSASEIRELLGKTVPALRSEDTVKLAGLCNGWPLLASVVSSALGQDVGAGALPERAVYEASQALHNVGPQAFDVWDSDQRKNAIGHAITASLSSLEEHVQITGAEHLSDRYLSLAIFPAATPIPLAVLSQWWGQAHGWTPSAVRQLCRVLADRSLIDAYLGDQDAVVLHDVFRAYLRHLIGPDWSGLHRSLVASHRQLAGHGWAELSFQHRYMWRQLAHHLHEAELGDELAELLATPSYVVKKAAHLGSEALALDNAAIERADRADTLIWRTAQALTSAGYLLHDLTSPQDIAGTLLAALSRASVDPNAIDGLRDIAGSQGFDILWATTDSSDGGAHTGAVAGVATHGNILVSGGEDGIVRIWDLAQRRLVHQRRGHTGWVYAVAISPDGQIIASAGDDATIRLWQLNTGQSTGILFGHDRRVRSLAFDAADRLVSAAEDGQVCVWDTDSANLTRTLRTTGSPAWAVATDVGGSLVAVAGEDEFLRLYDLDSGALLEEKAAHRDWIRCLGAAGDTLVSGSGDGTARVWKVVDDALTLARTIVVGARVRTVAVSPQADLIVTAGEDATLRAFAGDGTAGEQVLPRGIDWIRSAILRADGSVVAGCEDGSIRIWDGKGLSVIRHGSDTTWAAAFSGDHALLGRANGTVEVRDVTTSELIRTVSAGEGRVWSLAASSDVIAAACGDGTVRLWSMRDDWTLQLNDDEQRTWAVALNEAGTRLAASSAGNIVRVWALPSGHQLWERQAHDGRIRSLAFNDNGDLLLTGGGDGLARLWRLPGGDLAGEFTHGASWVRSVAIDDSRVALGCGPGVIYVHDITRGQVMAELHGHNGRVLMLGFCADPDALVSAAADGTVRLWSLSGQEQIAEVRVDASLQTAGLHARSGTVLAASAAGTLAVRVPAVRDEK